VSKKHEIPYADEGQVDKTCRCFFVWNIFPFDLVAIKSSIFFILVPFSIYQETRKNRKIEPSVESEVLARTRPQPLTYQMRYREERTDRL
jgi:hypothetical protein